MHFSGRASFPGGYIVTAYVRKSGLPLIGNGRQLPRVCDTTAVA